MTIQIGLTPQQIESRRGWIGGSDATVLMNGDQAAIHDLWQVKTGRKAPEDLSRVLPVMMGVWTEPFNRHWYEMTTGRSVSHAGEERAHGDLTFMHCTLDGLTTTETGEAALYEAKHVNAFSKIDQVAQKYMAQLHHAAFVAGVSACRLSVFIGTMTYELVDVELDEFYLAQLIDREREFWACVQSDTPPPGMAPIAAPAPPEQWRTIDMTGNNQWADNAAIWLSTKAAAGQFDTSAKALKGCIEPDVGTATGHGVKVSRAKNGNLSIREMQKT